MTPSTVVVRDSGVVVSDADEPVVAGGGGDSGGLIVDTDLSGSLLAFMLASDVYQVDTDMFTDADLVTELRGSVVELDTTPGAYAGIVDLMTAAGMSSTWDFTYDTSPADFGVGSDATLDGQASSTLVATGTTTNSTPLAPFLGKAIFSSASTVFDNLRGPADLDVHQGVACGAWVAFRLNNTTDTRAVMQFGPYGGTSSWFVLRTLGGNLVICEGADYTQAVVLGPAASFVGTTTLLCVNQFLLPPGLGGGARWEVHWRNDSGDPWNSATYTPTARAGRAQTYLNIGGFSSNIYRLPSAVLYHVSVKTTGCIPESHRDAFSQLAFGF